MHDAHDSADDFADPAATGDGRGETDDVTAKSDEVVYDWDIASDRIQWGPNFAAATGIGDVGVLSTGIGYAEQLAAESPSSRYEAIMASGARDLGGGVSFKAVYALLPVKRADVAPIWIEDAGRWFADLDGQPARVHGAIRVVADNPLGAERSRDAATGAFSRAHFIEHVARQLSLAARKESSFAILVVGLECDREGADAEAAVVKAVAAFQAEMRGHELLARHASAKLAMLLEDCNAEQAEAAGNRFLARFADNGDGEIRARIGAVLAPLHGGTPQSLLQFAEEALEAARLPGAAPVVLYHRDRVASKKPKRVASDDLESALEEDRLILALQPVVAASTHAVAFYEGLVRIEYPDGRLVMPETLVPEAERIGVVALVDSRVVDVAFVLLTSDRKLVLSINASVVSLHDASWLEHLRALCRRRPDAAKRLIVEITETSVIANLEALRGVLVALKQLGVRIAIDDFGSGHSSFRNLRNLPVDYLKIDGAFAQNLASSSDDRFFIRTLIDLARNLQIPIVAEWVEDEETAKILADWGVDYLQGHLFGKAEIAPLPGRKSAAHLEPVVG